MNILFFACLFLFSLSSFFSPSFSLFSLPAFLSHTNIRLLPCIRTGSSQDTMDRPGETKEKEKEEKQPS